LSSRSASSAGSQRPPACAQQEELGLDAGAQVPAALGQPRHGAAQHLARAGVEGLAVDEAVADDARHAGHPGQGAPCWRRRARSTPSAARCAAGRCPDRRAGKTGAVASTSSQLRQRHQLALGHAVQVGELHEQRVHAGRGQAGDQVGHR
jgi:hypothetical protein